MSAANPRYLILTEYCASSHQCCSWGHLYCRKDMSNNRQWRSLYLPVITFLDGCWRQNIRLNEGKLKVSPTMDLSHWTFLDHWKWCGILWECSKIGKNRHLEKKIESGAEVPKALQACRAPKVPMWGCLRKGSRNSSGVKMQTEAFTDGVLGYVERGNNEVKSYYWLCSFKWSCSRQSNRTAWCVTGSKAIFNPWSAREKGVSATGGCAHPQPH